MSKFRTSPEDRADMPPGIPFIVGNEAAERFSYYGMRAILVVFMTEHLLDASGRLAVMSQAEATSIYHAFVASVYATGILGALLADALFGKYLTIVSLSLVYCAGHVALALDETRLGLFVGLGLIAIGAGGIKPCVSAHVGDQFGARNQHLLERAFSMFYFAINVGAGLSMLATPYLLAEFGAHVAFAVPGVLMGLATLVFWLGRYRYAHVPPGGRAFLSEALGPEGRAVLKRMTGLTLFVAMFWALYDQQGSSWVLQAQRMDRHFLGIEWLGEQFQAANTVFILLFVPLFSAVLYPLAGRYVKVTATGKIALGFFLAAAAFLVPAFVEARLAAGAQPSIVWQILAYALLTAAEVLVSVTGLELFYSQAPNRMKSLMLAAWFLSVVLGNAFTALVNLAIERPDGTSRLSGEGYYLFFAAAMLFTAFAFVPFARRFRERHYVQGAEDAGDGELGARLSEREGRS
jgi:POT family proton-dependent oligopeptide transporter